MAWLARAGSARGTRSALAAALMAVTILWAAAAARAEADDLPWLHQSPTPSAQTPSAPATAAPSQVTPAPPPLSAPPTNVQPIPTPPPPSDAAPSLDTVRGSAQVLDTANLIVAGRTVALFGILGEGAPYDRQMSSYLASQGGNVECAPRGGRPDAPQYVCMTGAGYDVAEAALFNGGARASPEAPPDYLRQQELARAAKRGIWAKGHHHGPGDNAGLN